MHCYKCLKTDCKRTNVTELNPLAECLNGAIRTSDNSVSICNK